VLTSSVTQATTLLLGRKPDIRHPDFYSNASVILLLAYSISSPIFEETLVRGYFTTELIELGQPVWRATLASIVLQASYHLYYGLAGAVSISGVFIVFALYFARSRRVFPVLLAHAYWDLAVTLMRAHH